LVPARSSSAAACRTYDARANTRAFSPGVWSRDTDLTYEAGQDIKAGRVWVNTYNQYPAGAGFGGYKQSGYGRETDQQTLNNYQEAKNVLANHDPKPLGFFA
jgi:aldehyde dehydrogenase